MNDRCTESTADQWEKPSSIETSIYACDVIIQKIESWRDLLKKAKPLKQQYDIQKRIAKIYEVIFLESHKRTKYPEEIIIALYYDYVEKIREIKESYHSWVSGRNYNIDIQAFLNERPHIIKLINEELPKEFPQEKDSKPIKWTDEEKIEYIIYEERNSEVAAKFTAITTEMSVHSIKKKRKGALKKI
jgi:hypothetical protein